MDQIRVWYGKYASQKVPVRYRDIYIFLDDFLPDIMTPGDTYTKEKLRYDIIEKLGDSRFSMELLYSFIEYYSDQRCNLQTLKKGTLDDDGVDLFLRFTMKHEPEDVDYEFIVGTYTADISDLDTFKFGLQEALHIGPPKPDPMERSYLPTQAIENVIVDSRRESIPSVVHPVRNRRISDLKTPYPLRGDNNTQDGGGTRLFGMVDPRGNFTPINAFATGYYQDSNGPNPGQHSNPSRYPNDSDPNQRGSGSVPNRRGNNNNPNPTQSGGGQPPDDGGDDDSDDDRPPRRSPWKDRDPRRGGNDHQAVVEVETVAMEALDTHLLSTRMILGQMSFYTSFTRSSRRRTTLRSHRPCTLASITIIQI